MAGRPMRARTYSLRWFFRSVLATLAIGTVLAACAVEDDDRDPSGLAGDGATDPENLPQSRGGPCTDGEEQTCHLTLGRHNNVLTCYVGVQACASGIWGECEDGIVENSRSVGPDLTAEDLVTTGDGNKWKSYSNAKDCAQNPCDPGCKEFIEDPCPDLGAGGKEFIYEWNQGKKNNLPADVYDKAFKEPCQIGSDCQLNHFCYDPNSGSCTHDVCTTGKALKPDCSRCVTEICKAKPKCCEYAYQGSCAHSPCLTGDALNPSCDPDVKFVCDNKDKTCCPYSNTVIECAWQTKAYACQKSSYCYQAQPCLQYKFCGWTYYDCSYWQMQSQYSCWWATQWYWATVCTWKNVCVMQYQCKTITVCKVVAQYQCQTVWYQSCYTVAQQVCYQSCWKWGWNWGCSTTCYWNYYQVCSWKSYQNCWWNYVTVCSQQQSCSWVNVCNMQLICSQVWTSKQVWTCGWKMVNVYVPKTCSTAKYCWVWETCQVWGLFCTYWDTCYKQEWVCAPKTYYYPGSWKQGCVDAYKAKNPNACYVPDWNKECVDGVHDICGAFCKDPPPPEGEGDCLPWDPGQKDDKCNGIALSVGLTCDNTVPICNHGTKDAPSGIKIIHVPKGSGGFGKANPGILADTQTCTTDKVIKAGECVSVMSCPGLNAGREIMVNPPGAGQLTECYYGDNWGIYVPGLCGPPICAANNFKTKIKPVNMFITVDKSGSMGGARWTGTKKAFQAFFKDKASGGLNIGLEFWPHPSCADGSNCNDIAGCADPYVPFGKLTADQAPKDAQEQKLVAAFDSTSPSGGTPAYVALQGAEKWAKDYTITHKNEQQVVIFVTDGYPGPCQTGTPAFAALAKDAYDTQGVLTYGIGIVGASTEQLTAIAAAGKGEAFFIDNANQVEQKLIAAMSKIKGDTMKCDFDLPISKKLYEPEDADVSYLPSGGGSPTIFPRVNSLLDCGKGWYFDNNFDPKKIHLCPLNCTAVQADGKAEIDISFGCPGGFLPATHTQLYEASCPDGKTPQWGFLAYKTGTPSTTKAIFTARTAATKLELVASTYTDLATAHLTPTDTQLCKMAGPAPCPIDIVSKMGKAAIGKNWLELKIDILPNKFKSKTAIVYDYNLTYSCADNE
ncbi:MAG: VWA domain-containing protein [Myxococcales bacterium]|nr:VWA domain-containing protein [Myxococcales bacterium]